MKLRPSYEECWLSRSQFKFDPGFNMPQNCSFACHVKWLHVKLWHSVYFFSNTYVHSLTIYCSLFQIYRLFWVSENFPALFYGIYCAIELGTFWGGKVKNTLYQHLWYHIFPFGDKKCWDRDSWKLCTKRRLSGPSFGANFLQCSLSSTHNCTTLLLSAIILMCGWKVLNTQLHKLFIRS